MVYWSTVIFKVDNDGYYNRHHRTYLWYTGLYLKLTMMVTITDIIILTVDNDGYYNRHHRTTYLCLPYTGLPVISEYLQLTMMVTITDIIELIYGILVYRNTYS